MGICNLPPTLGLPSKKYRQLDWRMDNNDEIVETRIRMPGMLDRRLLDSAKAKGISRNQEMVMRLVDSFVVEVRPLASYSDGDLVRELVERHEKGKIKNRDRQMKKARAGRAGGYRGGGLNLGLGSGGLRRAIKRSIELGEAVDALSKNNYQLNLVGPLPRQQGSETSNSQRVKNLQVQLNVHSGWELLRRFKLDNMDLPMLSSAEHSSQALACIGIRLIFYL